MALKKEEWKLLRSLVKSLLSDIKKRCGEEYSGQTEEIFEKWTKGEVSIYEILLQHIKCHPEFWEELEV